MALQKDLKSVPFVEGPDTKTDPKLSVKPERMENAVFVGGSVAKVPGRDELPDGIAGGGTQSAGEALFSREAELVRINGGTTYGLAAQTQQWVAKQGGNNYASLASKDILATPGTGIGICDFALVNGVGVVAWAQAGIHVAVFDAATGTFFQDGALAITSSVSGSVVPRLVVLGSTVLILWADFANADLYSAVVSTASPTTVPTQTQIRTDAYTGAVTFDAIAYNEGLAVVAYATSASGAGRDITLIGVNAAGAVTASPAPTVVGPVALASGLATGIMVQRDTAGNIYVVFASAVAGTTEYFVRDASFGAVLVPTLISALYAFSRAASFEATANQITIITSTNIAYAGSNQAQALGSVVVGASGVVTVFANIPSTCGLVIVSDAVGYDGTAILGVINTDVNPNTTPSSSGFQTSAFIINLSGRVVGRAMPYEAMQETDGTAVVRVRRSFFSENTARMVFRKQQRTQYISDGGGGVTSISAASIAIVSIEDTGAQPLPAVQVGSTLYIGGAYPRVYDGLLIGEAGFSLYPDGLDVVDGGAVVSALSAGTYQWKFLYSWTLANGELVRGPVSPPISETFGAANHEADITVAPMPLAMRDRIVAGGNTLIEVYRTTANGTVFYRQSSLTSGPQNTTASGSNVTFTDSTTDASLVFGELLYAQNGVLDWEAPPSYSAACAHEGRLAIVGLENPLAWTVSSQWTTGEAIRFSSVNTGYIPDATGPIVGCASLDGKLILFTTETAYFVTGDGPDLLGNNQYGTPQRIVSVDSGPISAKSIVVTPDGVMFQSKDGLTLLDRGLNTSLIGADVEEYVTAPYTIRAASLDASNERVRFLADPGSDIIGAQTGQLVPSNGGVELTYDYFYKQWSVQIGRGGQACCFYQDRFTSVRSDGVVFRESLSHWMSEGQYVSSLVETPWIKVAGIQARQRIYYMRLLGTYGSDFTITVKVAYSYEGTTPTVPTWTETKTLDGTGLFQLGGPFEVRQHLGRKCTAVKFQFSDAPAGTGEGMLLSDMTFEFGLKPGVEKLPASKTL